jgi:hypothetical protein
VFAPILIALTMTAQAPAPKPVFAPKPILTPAQLKDQHQAEMTRTNQLKKLAALKKNAQRSAKARADYQAALAQQAYLDKMAPIWAAEARENARVAIAQQSANAVSSMANAEHRKAAALEAEVRIEARAAGYPQIGLRQVVP